MLKMLKKTLLCCLMISSLVAMMMPAAQALADDKISSVSSSVSEPAITGEAAIVMDAKTMQIYYQKNIHEKLYPASITKILTGLIVVEHSSPSDIVTVLPDVTKSQSKSYANIALLPGENVTKDELLNTMFLASANDSAQVLAEHIGGTLDNFVNMMNYRARQLGCVDSSFSNSNGLPDKNNITSAYDMALITMAAIKNQTFMKYFGAYQYTLPPTNMRNDVQVFTTLHKMMKKTVYYDKDVIAGKTGWETMSSNTLVTIVEKDGRTLICVQLKVDTSYTLYTEAKKLLDYGFSQPAQQVFGISYSSTNQTAVAASVTETKNILQPKVWRKIQIDSFVLKLPGCVSVAIIFLSVVFMLIYKRRKKQTRKITIELEVADI